MSETDADGNPLSNRSDQPVKKKKKKKKKATNVV